MVKEPNKVQVFKSELLPRYCSPKPAPKVGVLMQRRLTEEGNADLLGLGMT